MNENKIENENVINQKIRKKKINNSDSLFVELDNNSFLDINAEFHWNCETLTEMQKKFIFFYTYPFFNAVKGKGAASCRNAGYSEKTARNIYKNLLLNNEIYNEIKNIKNQISEKLTKINLQEELNKIITQKIRRTQININDFYTLEKTTNEDGVEYVKGMIKPSNELTNEQKELIEDIEFVGQRGILHYKLPNKRESENELIKIYKELYNTQEKENNEFDVETTVDVIKDNLKVKTKIINHNSQITQLSDLKENSDNKNKEEED